MPYIKGEKRVEIDAIIGPVKYYISNYPKPGELNYIITSLIQAYYSVWSRGYADYNEVIGVLECVKQEFYRRVVAEYEEVKRKENGDVYPQTRGTDTKTSDEDEEL